MKNTKLTNVKALEMVLAMAEVQNNAELVEKLENMKAQFEKKNASRANGEKKPTKTLINSKHFLIDIHIYLIIIQINMCHITRLFYQLYL